MPTLSPSRGLPRRAARLGLAGAALLAAVGGASADENGLGDFFSSIFGGRPQQAAAPSYAPAPVYERAPAYQRAPVFRPRAMRDRTLTVRLHPQKPRLVVAQTPTKPGKVSIYEDRTLRRGDAVMMKDGVRVFAGSSSWPYAPSDFVALKDAKGVDRDTGKVLAQLDKLPRG